jgi:glycosyltransferase involved in cell wall biosynthesis
MSTSLSIIIPCLNEGASLDGMIHNINNTIELDNYQIIIVNSGGTDTSRIRKLKMVRVYNSTTRLGAPQARNFGANNASSDMLLFADAHLRFKQGWGPKILNNLEDCENSIIAPCITAIANEKAGGYGFVWMNLKMEIKWLPKKKCSTYEIPFAGGACLAVEKKMFDQIGQFDSGIILWGGADFELCLRAWLLGYRVLCDPSIVVAHGFRRSHPYKVGRLDIHHNRIRVAFSHFNSDRLSRYLKFYAGVFGDVSNFNKALLMNIVNHVLDRRELLFKTRIYTDDWFFRKFPMNGWNK